VFYVYLLESLMHHGQRYVGLTVDLKKRLQEHNAGRSAHTSKYAPWRLVTYVAFQSASKRRALNDISNQAPVTHSLPSVSGSLQPPKPILGA
jgi:putative endonuclease